MSNVLIGIIGVILFIGLALAGALFLGPRFQESTNSSKAAAISAAIAQSANAVHLYEANEGKRIVVGDYPLMMEMGYMKTRPYEAYVRDVDGGSLDGSKVDMIMISSTMNPSFASDEICRAYNRQVGSSGSDAVQSLPTAPMTMRNGCFRTSAPLGLEPEGAYLYIGRM